MSIENTPLLYPIEAIVDTEVISAQKQAEAVADLLQIRLHRAVYEASHRIKNQLQFLYGTVDTLIIDHAKVVPVEELCRLRSQIGAIATTHDLLMYATRTDGTTDHISVKSLLERTLAAIQQTTDRHQLRYTVDEALVPVKTATSLALIVNEAVSNALKHGGEKIEVTLTVEAEDGRLEIGDDGSGFPEGFNPPRAAHTGLELLLTLTRVDLSGLITFNNRAEGGASVVIIFPLPSTPPSAI